MKFNRGMKAVFFALCLALSFSVHSSGSASDVYLEDALWPVMRADGRNTGRAEILSYRPMEGTAEEPVHFRTGNGIFSTPVMDGNEIVYVGSADHFFYALDPHRGEVLWKVDMHEIIDSAAALGRGGRVYVPAGDARIHALDLSGNELWSFDVLSDRPKGLYSLSTNYWWEANVTIGPEGDLYAGNDDFFFYRLGPEGDMRWAFRTGMLIWSASSFDRDTVYIAGFDMKLYALDRLTGKLKWKTHLGNPLVASPAVGSDGTVYQGAMDGRVYALEPDRGKVVWSMQTGGHVYASAAVAPDNRIYVTSTDGFLYCLDAGTGAAAWTFYTGDAVRSSPVIGPDPEGKADYLVYFGGGEGMVYAIDPAGRRRWSYNTLAASGRTDYPNINASPALGSSGLAVASANGDVVWIPYDYYMKKNAVGVVRDPSDGFGHEGGRFYYISPGGRIAKQALPAEAPGKRIEVHPGRAVTMRLILRKNGRTMDARLVPGSVTVETSPRFAARIELIGDGKTLVVLPEGMLEPGGVYSLKVNAEYQTVEGGERGKATGAFSLMVEEAREDSPLASSAGKAFEITHMAVPLPAIVPSLDQIGIASLSIPFSIVETDRESGRFTAWAVQRFGETEQGEPVGVPDRRSLFYAFSGRTAGDFFVIESRNCFFEGTSFPFPLDTFRLSGRALPDGRVERGASLFAEWTPEGIIKGLGLLSVSTEEERGGRESWLASALAGGGSPKGFFSALAKTVPAMLGYLRHKVWKPWGIYNSDGKFVGVGTFRMRELPEKLTTTAREVEVLSFAHNKRKNRVTAEVRIERKDTRRQTVVGIMLVDSSTGRPVPVNYNTATRRIRESEQLRRVVLDIPSSAVAGAGIIRAYLMVDLRAVDMLEIKL